MKPRRLGRSLALQALYEIDLAGHSAERVLDRPPHEQPDELRLAPEEIGEATVFARQLVDGVLAHQAEIDAIIRKIAPEWPLEQLAVVDRTILRLALVELMYLQTPQKVAINEAVELAKKFGGDSTPRFVNGALGAYVNQT